MSPLSCVTAKVKLDKPHLNFDLACCLLQVVVNRVIIKRCLKETTITETRVQSFAYILFC